MLDFFITRFSHPVYVRTDEKFEVLVLCLCFRIILLILGDPLFFIVGTSPILVTMWPEILPCGYLICIGSRILFSQGKRKLSTRVKSPVIFILLFKTEGCPNELG